MRLALGVLAVEACLSVSASSQEREITAPLASERSGIPLLQHPPSDGHQEGTGAGEGERGPSGDATDAAPVPPMDRDPHAAEHRADARDENDRGWSERAVAALGSLSVSERLQAVFSGLLVVLGFLQWRVTRKQAAISADQKAISADQKDIGTDQARIMDRQREIAAEQTAILKAQARTGQILPDLELPAVFIFRVDGPKLADRGSAHSGDAKRLTATLHFANYGRTPAIIEEIQALLVLKQDRPLVPTYGRVGPTFRPDLLLTGLENAKTWPVVSAPLSEDDLSRFERHEFLADVYGRIIYRDVFGSRFAAGFGFIAGPCDAEFDQIPVGDYNYRRPFAY